MRTIAPDRTSFVPYVFGLLRLAFCRGGRLVGRRVRRFFQRGVGGGTRWRNYHRRAHLFSALARSFLPGADPISRFSELRRRIQSDGSAPLTGHPHFLPQMRQIVHLMPKMAFQLESRVFPSSSGGIADAVGGCVAARFPICFTPAWRIGWDRGAESSDPLGATPRDIARSVQAMYEEAFFHLLGALAGDAWATDLALAGGCAANSVANGKVVRQTEIRSCLCAIRGRRCGRRDRRGICGVAQARWQRARFVMNHASWGPHFSADEIDAVHWPARRAEIDASALRRFATIPDEGELCSATAALIAGGNVVGWFQGRMEWGPRALGNRSILADPRRAGHQRASQRQNQKGENRSARLPLRCSTARFKMV